MVEAGTYTAKTISHTIALTKKGDPQSVVTFEVTAKDGTHKITYYGSFSEKAREYTIKNLITLGLKGNNPAGELDVGKQVELVIDLETGDDGKTRPKVKFINLLGQVRNAIPQDLARAKLADLEGAVMAARSKINSKDDEEIPF